MSHHPEREWPTAEELAFKPPTLAPGQVDDFLGWLFTRVARKVRISLRETEGAVGYLLRLAKHGVPVEVKRKGKKAIEEYRSETERPSDDRLRMYYATEVAMNLWRELLAVDVLPLAPPGKVKAYIRTRAQAGMAWGAQLLRVLDGYAIPDDCKKTPRRVLLTNLHTWDYRPAAPNPRLQDDLTERIFIAYHALKQIHVKKTRDLIAKKLNSLGAPPNQTDAKSGSAWGEPEVNSRVMQFRKVLLAEAPKRNTEEPTKFVAARTAQMVAVAVSGWAFHREVEESNRLRSSQSAPADQGHRGG